MQNVMRALHDATARTKLLSQIVCLTSLFAENVCLRGSVKRVLCGEAEPRDRFTLYVVKLLTSQGPPGNVGHKGDEARPTFYNYKPVQRA